MRIINSNKVIILLSLIIIILLITNVISMKNKKEIEKNFHENVEGKNVDKVDLESPDSNNQNASDSTKIQKSSYLKGLGNVRLHFSPEGHPSYGYKAEINTFPKSDDTKVEIIESRDNWAKISISGWIPKWYLAKEKSVWDEGYTIYPKEKRTVNKDTRLYLIPDEEKNIGEYIDSTLLYKGQVVELLYDYNEWIYVKRYILRDANQYREGWIKKSDLSIFDELRPSEVKIKKGTTVYSIFDGYKEPIVLERDIFVFIENMQNGWYEVISNGTAHYKIKEKDFKFIY